MDSDHTEELKELSLKAVREHSVELRKRDIVSKLTTMAKVGPLSADSLVGFLTTCSLLAINNDLTAEELAELLLPLVRPDLKAETTEGFVAKLKFIHGEVEVVQ